MLAADFTYTQFGYNDYIIVRGAKASAPGVLVGVAQSFGTPPPPTVNIVYPVPDTDVYQFTFYDSPDGVALGEQIAIFTFNVALGIVVSEQRFYTGGGPETFDPAINASQIIDPYLDGKPISEVFKEAWRFLEHGTEWLEHAGGGIDLLNGYTIDNGEKLSVTISYLVNQIVNTTGGAFNGLQIITADTLIDNSYAGKRVKCETPAATRLVVTFPHLAAFPEGQPMWFTAHAGSQYKVRFLSAIGERILFNGMLLTEISIGKGEYMYIERRGGVWEVISDIPGMHDVGDDVDVRLTGRSNFIPYDARIVDGDDEPRLYWWVMNILPATSRIAVADDVLTNAGYQHPGGKEGLYVVSLTTKKMRMPNLQTWHKRGLKDFNNLGGADGHGVGDRAYNYPGGTKNDTLKRHSHKMKMGSASGKSDNANDRNVMVPIEPGAERVTELSIGDDGVTLEIETQGRNVGYIFGAKS